MGAVASSSPHEVAMVLLQMRVWPELLLRLRHSSQLFDNTFVLSNNSRFVMACGRSPHFFPCKLPCSHEMFFIAGHSFQPIKPPVVGHGIAHGHGGQFAGAVGRDKIRPIVREAQGIAELHSVLVAGHGAEAQGKDCSLWPNQNSVEALGVGCVRVAEQKHAAGGIGDPERRPIRGG